MHTGPIKKNKVSQQRFHEYDEVDEFHINWIIWNTGAVEREGNILGTLA